MCNNLVLIMLVAVEVNNATFDNFDLRSSLVGCILDNNLKAVEMIKSDHRFD